MKTVDLRTAVVTVLQAAMPPGGKVYFQQAEKEPVYPYAVYTVDLIDNTDERDLYELEVNLVGYGADTEALENLTDAVMAAFNKKVIINDSIGVYFFADRRNIVEEEDRRIIRRRLTFSAYLYER